MVPTQQNIRVNSRIQIPASELEWSFARSSGPGGQNVNKVSSKALLRWPIATSPSLPDDVRSRFLARYANRITGDGEFYLSSQRYRDQGRNVEDCIEKLRQMVADVVSAPRKRKVTRPTLASNRRRREGKQQNAAKKWLRRDVSED